MSGGDPDGLSPPGVVPFSQTRKGDAARDGASPSAPPMAWRASSFKSRGYRKRTSVFAGWTLTSTSRGLQVTNR